MRWLLKASGILWDAITGPCETSEVTGDFPNQYHHYMPDILPSDQKARVVSRKILYRTRYRRWWIPDRHFALYQVCGVAEGQVQGELVPRFFEPLLFPSLSNWLLRDTEYPHVYAVNAFLDRVYPLSPDAPPRI